LFVRHSGEGRNPLFSCVTATWIPAFAGMTVLEVFQGSHVGAGRARDSACTERAYSQPFCRASLYASMRLLTPSLPIASDK
jgi:hypothetical protein